MRDKAGLSAGAIAFIAFIVIGTLLLTCSLIMPACGVGILKFVAILARVF